MKIDQFTVEAPNVQYTEEHIISRYQYGNTKLVQGEGGKWVDAAQGAQAGRHACGLGRQQRHHADRGCAGQQAVSVRGGWGGGREGQSWERKGNRHTMGNRLDIPCSNSTPVHPCPPPPSCPNAAAQRHHLDDQGRREAPQLLGLPHAGLHRARGQFRGRGGARALQGPAAHGGAKRHRARGLGYLAPQHGRSDGARPGPRLEPAAAAGALHEGPAPPARCIYDPEFIAANQAERADNCIKGSKAEQVEVVRGQIRDFKKNTGVDKVIVLWTANTERYSQVRGKPVRVGSPFQIAPQVEQETAQVLASCV
eukprot:1160892-Pelagomonas_calceolata.AAC.8